MMPPAMEEAFWKEKDGLSCSCFIGTQEQAELGTFGLGEICFGEEPRLQCSRSSTGSPAKMNRSRDPSIAEQGLAAKQEAEAYLFGSERAI